MAENQKAAIARVRTQIQLLEWCDGRGIPIDRNDLEALRIAATEIERLRAENATLRDRLMRHDLGDMSKLGGF
jgi:hypothetical protein